MVINCFVWTIAVQHKIFRKRHKPKVAVVGAACAAEVGGAEAEDGVVGGVVAGAAVPVVHAGVGTELHHAEGHRGTREGVAVAACANERIDIFGRISDIINLRLLVTGCKRQKKQRKELFFHRL